MKSLLKPFQYLYCIYAAILFIVTMLLIFPFVLIASLFGINRGGSMIYMLCSVWADIWFLLVGIFHRNVYEAPHDKKKQYIFVANHISYLDGPMIVKSIRQPLRALGKIEMKKIPVFGFIYSYAVIKVDRSNTENRAKSVRNLRSVLRKKISIIIFPEGTFNLTKQPLKEFYDGAFRVAIETQTPIKPVLFLKAYDRMPGGLFTLNPGPSLSVFLEEIPVEGMSAADMPELKKTVYKIMDEKLREYKASWISSPTP